MGKTFQQGRMKKGSQPNPPRKRAYSVAAEKIRAEEPPKDIKGKELKKWYSKRRQRAKKAQKKDDEIAGRYNEITNERMQTEESHEAVGEEEAVEKSIEDKKISEPPPDTEQVEKEDEAKTADS